MYNKSFWERTNINSLVEFMVTGMAAKDGNVDERTAEERHKLYYNNLLQEMCKAVDKVLITQWDGLDHNSKLIQAEEIFQEAIEATYKLSDLAFEVGISTGMKIVGEGSKRVNTCPSEEVLIKFIPESAPAPDEIEAIGLGRDEIGRNEIVRHNEIDWS